MRLSLPLTLTAGLLLTACGTTTLDAGKAEGEIKKQMIAQVGLVPSEIKCPEDREAKQGDKFDCEAVFPGNRTADVAVTQQDDEGNVRFNFTTAEFQKRVKTFKGIELDTALLEKNIAQQVEGGNAKVECPDRITIEKGNSMDCTGTIGSDQTKLKVTLTDELGNFEYAPIG